MEPKPSSTILAWPQRLWQAASSPSLNILPPFRRVMRTQPAFFCCVFELNQRNASPSSRPHFIACRGLFYRERSLQFELTGWRPRLQVCSSGGCTSTSPLSFLTASAPPQNQPPPTVSAAGPHALNVSWEPPTKPNGNIDIWPPTCPRQEMLILSRGNYSLNMFQAIAKCKLLMFVL